MRTVGIVGYGAFGKLVATLVRRFAPTLEVRVYSSRREPDGKDFFSLVDAVSSDVVIFTVPISAFEEMLLKILPLTCADTILVDVCTVKVHTVNLLKKHAREKQWLATHPMWGPESYEKKKGDVTGFRIVITESTLPEEKAEAFSEVLKQMGFEVVHMNADTHDKHLAETLFLTHFVGQVIARARFDRTEIDTVSFGYLMDAVESVKNDGPLFRDVFAFNPYCKEVLERFGVAEDETRMFLKK